MRESQQFIVDSKRHPRRANGTTATETLRRLRDLSDVDLRQVLDVALEYADNPAIAGKSGPAAKRLLMQLEWAIEEVVR